MSAKIRKKHELDAGYRQRISAGVKERLKEPAVRERLLEACRDPVRRAKISASRKGRNNMSEALLERVSRAKSKLAKDICMIRKLHFRGLSIQTLARPYGVSFSTMSRAIRGIRRAYKDGAPNFADVQEAISRNRERAARKRRRLKDGDVAELFRMRAAGVPLRRIAVKFQVTHHGHEHSIGANISRQRGVPSKRKISLIQRFAFLGQFYKGGSLLGQADYADFPALLADLWVRILVRPL